MLGCSTAPSANHRPSAGGKADEGGNGSAYYSVTRDLRACVAPACGGFFVHALNQELTTCLDETQAPLCHVLEIDSSSIGNDIRAAAIVRGNLETRYFTGFGGKPVAVGVLVAMEAWKPGALSGTAEGTFYKLSQGASGIDEEALNRNGSASASAISSADANRALAATDDYRTRTRGRASAPSRT